MTAAESHPSAPATPLFRVCARLACLVLYGAALAVGPLFGYASIPLFCAMVVLVVAALAIGARVRALAIITVGGVLAALSVLLLGPNPKGPDGLIPILRHHYREAQRPGLFDGTYATPAEVAPFFGEVLELHHGQFSYWAFSDVVSRSEPAYPLRGHFRIDGDRVVLEVPILIRLVG